MAKLFHTEGEWRFEQSQGGSWFIYAEDDSPIKQPRIKIPKRFTKQGEANMRLIVAAVNEFKRNHDLA